MSTTYPLSPLDLEAAPPLEESPNKAIKLAELEEEDDETYTTAEYTIEQQADYWESKWGRLGRLMGFLIRHGCEARGIQPVAIKVPCFLLLLGNRLRSLTLLDFCVLAGSSASDGVELPRPNHRSSLSFPTYPSFADMALILFSLLFLFLYMCVQ